MEAPNPHVHTYRMAGWLLLLALISFIVQVTVFTTEYRPDEWRALPTFLMKITGSIGLTEELWVRVCLILFNAACVTALYVMRLITRDTLWLALVWPLTLFLFSKIYWEFFVFPLCLVRVDLCRRDEALFIVALISLLLVSGEANLGVILLWRSVLMLQKCGLKWVAPLGLILVGLAIDWVMAAGYSAQIPLIGSEIARFSWTRDVVNPEYSILETAAVFFASFHFFSLHSGAYWIDALFSLLVLALIFNRIETWDAVREHAATLIAFASVVLFFTSITHAFQNARYYFFFMPVLATLVPRDRLVPIAALGIFHVALRGLSL
ncbi:MAG: hypothetical protein AB8B71_06885 [Paracoccaceae bacterium]